MAQLRYKPENINPQGKPRVYFACHEQDFKGYFQTICDDILKISNCAVYYYEEEPEQDEDFFLNQGRMNLLVMPVTSRLLYLPNRAMDVEFSYAAAHHIPVLPLMQESGLEEKYKEKFGDLQFLNKYDPDPTALPYADKLKKYLEAVLVGDALAERIRAAFDAYIFLSYRKKDRKLAQELMKLIHKNPLCRSLAIWYDEFLTPGESFNDAIRDALEKSDLFMLAVTPNLVNEINYIMTTEYPMAREAGKPILPARMEDTDREALAKLYPAIPEDIDPRAGEILLERLRFLAKQKNDSDPEHNFFVGLAYLTGIDVEVDHPYAVEMITSAAEAGLTEAMEKLAFMYETGEGVKRDYMTAISWREKLVEQARQRWESEECTEDCWYAYLECLWGLGNAWKAIWNLSKAKQVFKQMCEVAEIFKLFDEGLKTSRYVMLSYHVLGCIAQEQSSIDEALVLHSKSFEIAKDLLRRGEFQAIQDYLIVCCSLGDINYDLGKVDKAQELYTHGIEVCGKMFDLGYREIFRNYIEFCQRNSRISLENEDYSGARKWCLKARNECAKLTEFGTDDDRWWLSVLNTDLADIFLFDNNIEDARRWYGSAMDIREDLVHQNPDRFLHGLALSYFKMGEVELRISNLSEAKEWYLKALSIYNGFADMKIKCFQRDIACIYERLALINEDDAHYVEAKKWYLLCADTVSRYLFDATYETQWDLFDIYYRIGSLCTAQNDVSEVVVWYEKAIEIWNKIGSGKKTSKRRMLAEMYEELGDIYKERNELNTAKKYYMLLWKMNKIMAESGDPNDIEALADACFKLGWLLRDVDLLNVAKNIYVELAEKYPANRSRFIKLAKLTDVVITNKC